MIGFDEFQPKKWAPVKRINEFSQTDRSLAPVHTTSLMQNQNADAYPRTYSRQSLAQKAYNERAKKAKPPTDLDDPWNTNYKGKRNVNNPAIASGWSIETAEKLGDDLYGKTDALAGGKTRLQNTPAARHPIMQLYGNIERVRADDVEDVRVLEHSNRLTKEQIAKEDQEALQFYTSVLPHYQKVNFHQPLTPLPAAFLSPENIGFLHREIEMGLTRDLASGHQGETQTVVKIDFYEDLASGLIQKAMKNSSMPASDLPLLNRSFITEEIRNYAPSLRSQERYRRQILEGNNEKYMDRGEATRTVKGEVTIDMSSRDLKHPSARFHQAYLAATGMGPKK
jgi:hypothetical protein